MAQNFLETTHHSVAWFRKRNDANELVLRAPFQRQGVWTDKQKSFLIDTILQGFPIPELYVQEIVEDDGSETFVVVDGQQRLRACFEFLDGQFTIDPVDSPEFAGLSFEDLTKEQRQKLYSYNFVVRKLPQMTDKEIRGIFSRINKNTVQLNSQELRHATYWGPFIKSAELLATLPSWSSLGVFTPNDVRRMMNVEFTSELMIAYLYGHQNKKVNLEKSYKAFEKNFERRSEVERVFRKVLSEINRIWENLERSRWRKKSDFYTLFLVLSKHHEELPLSEHDSVRFANKLKEFGADVDKFTSDRDRPDEYSKDVRDYLNVVEKSASDFGNRKLRFEIIERVFEDVAKVQELDV